MNILVLVVVYKKSMLDSETLQSLLKCKLNPNDTVLIWDNSPQPQLNRNDLSELAATSAQIVYNHSSENLPLSALYNRVISDYLPGHDYLCLMDHDSDFAPAYFEEWREVSNSHPQLNLFLPIVRTAYAIVSPATLYGFKGFYWKEARYGIISAKNVAAINSGMIISASYLTREFQGYDTRLKFYGTDTYFMKEYWKQQHPVYVMRSELKHTLDFFENNNIDDKIRRFREIRRSTYILSGRNIFSRIITGSYLAMLSLYYSAKNRNFGFLK